MAFSPDKTTSRSISSDKNHDIPDGKPLRLVRQFHFGSQCATGSVYWHLPAKVRLKKAHFGKPPLTECVLRHPPCQSELAEASTTFCGTHEFPSKTKATGRPSARAKMPDSPASQQYTLRAMPSSATMEETISPEMERSVRGVSLLRATKACHEVEKHLLI